ncbi:MAG: helix-turn-helix domain-containing protein [Ktedonobacteraceae bacterium]
MDYDDFRRRLGKRIRILRLEKNIKQERLAELVDKSTEHVSFIERGERSPSLEMLMDISNVLGVSVSSLLDVETDKKEVTNTIPAPLPPGPLPNTIEDPIKPTEQRKDDLERLQRGLENIKALQQLANDYDISDIFQDNGGKVLQLLILLGLKQSKGREGNDAIDEEGNEYELKTINLSLNPRAGITTHHHMTKKIIEKYRIVTWYIGLYEGIELTEIWKFHPSKLEVLFASWEKWIDDHNGQPRNNPKIPLRYVRKGERVYRNPNSQSQN